MLLGINNIEYYSPGALNICVHAVEIESELRMQEFDHQRLKRHWDGIRSEGPGRRLD